MQQRTWKVMGAAGAVLCGTMAGWAPGPATAGAARTTTYVAAGFYVIGPDHAAAVVASSTGVHTAPLGWVGIVPESDRFTVRIEDANPLSGSVAVTMLAGGGWRRDMCVPRGQDVEIVEAPAGRHVSLFIWDAVPDRSWCPDSMATTGTLTITS